MRQLQHVLTFKIGVTIVAWAVPLLGFPVAWLVLLGFPAPEPSIFLRLLGMAYAALVFGYVRGLQKARRGEHPSDAVWVGVVSNGGATVVLGIGAVRDAWAAWGGFAQGYMWLSLVSVAAITAGLLRFGVEPGGAP